MSKVLKAAGLCKTYKLSKQNSFEALKDINLEVDEGEFVSVMGPSGSGKSSLLYSISSMDRMTSGSVVFDGIDISNCTENELTDIRLKKMGFIFQDALLLKNLCILDNIVISAFLSNEGTRKNAVEYAMTLMRMVGIEGIAMNDITQASGGQLQRVGICRALINHPRIIFADEPTGALNSKATTEVMEILNDINRSGTTILIVTHDAKVAAITERVLYMRDGGIISELRLEKFDKAGQDLMAREKELSAWLQTKGF